MKRETDEALQRQDEEKRRARDEQLKQQEAERIAVDQARLQQQRDQIATILADQSLTSDEKIIALFKDVNLQDAVWRRLKTERELWKTFVLTIGFVDYNKTEKTDEGDESNFSLGDLVDIFGTALTYEFQKYIDQLTGVGESKVRVLERNRLERQRLAKDLFIRYMNYYDADASLYFLTLYGRFLALRKRLVEVSKALGTLEELCIRRTCGVTALLPGQLTESVGDKLFITSLELNLKGVAHKFFFFVPQTKPQQFEARCFTNNQSLSLVLEGPALVCRKFFYDGVIFLAVASQHSGVKLVRFAPDGLAQAQVFDYAELDLALLARMDDTTYIDAEDAARYCGTMHCAPSYEQFVLLDVMRLLDVKKTSEDAQAQIEELKRNEKALVRDPILTDDDINYLEERGFVDIVIPEDMSQLEPDARTALVAYRKNRLAQQIAALSGAPVTSPLFRVPMPAVISFVITEQSITHHKGDKQDLGWRVCTVPGKSDELYVAVMYKKYVDDKTDKTGMHLSVFKYERTDTMAEDGSGLVESLYKDSGAIELDLPTYSLNRFGYRSRVQDFRLVFLSADVFYVETTISRIDVDLNTEQQEVQNGMLCQYAFKFTLNDALVTEGVKLDRPDAVILDRLRQAQHKLVLTPCTDRLAAAFDYVAYQYKNKRTALHMIFIKVQLVGISFAQLDLSALSMGQVLGLTQFRDPRQAGLAYVLVGEFSDVGLLRMTRVLNISRVQKSDFAEYKDDTSLSLTSALAQKLVITEDFSCALCRQPTHTVDTRTNTFLCDSLCQHFYDNAYPMFLTH
jgi:hypothetical protein